MHYNWYVHFYFENFIAILEIYVEEYKTHLVSLIALIKLSLATLMLKKAHVFIVKGLTQIRIFDHIGYSTMDVITYRLQQELAKTDLAGSTSLQRSFFLFNEKITRVKINILVPIACLQNIAL